MCGSSLHNYYSGENQKVARHRCLASIYIPARRLLNYLLEEIIMRKIVGIGIVICLAMLMVSPAAACHAWLLKTGPAEACTNCDITYTIHVTHDTLTGYSVKVVDTLPAGVTYVSSSDSGSYNAGTGKVTWIYAAGTAPTKDLTVTVQMGSPATLGNFAESWVKHCIPGATCSYENHVASSTVTTVVKDCIPTPEFPSMFLPATMMIGFLGAVLLIQKTRE
jgi:uncharacterized repeat protein (TIGR01451 family)